MRSSDWSSDVCSSDLVAGLDEGDVVGLHPRLHQQLFADGDDLHDLLTRTDIAADGRHLHVVHHAVDGRADLRPLRPSLCAPKRLAVDGDLRLQLATLVERVLTALVIRFRLLRRSEEHTSELQSLMRISYAVFFLNKKNTQQPSTQRQ